MNNLKVGVIGIPGKWSTEVLADRLEEMTGFRLVIDMAEVTLDLASKHLMFRGINLCELDGLIVKKISQAYSPSMLDRIELLRVAEQAGVRVFSRPESILRLVDRLSCTVTLRNHDIPMPKTCVTESLDAAVSAIEEYGEVVLKPLFSTKARGMTLLNAKQPRDELRSQLSLFQQDNPMLYLQQKCDLHGQDLGIVFLGGEYIGTYARVSQSDSWNTTILAGGEYKPFTPDDEVIALAKKAQQPFALDFTTVDVAFTDDGPIVFEVSAFGGFKGALDGCGIDAAKLYSQYIIDSFAG
ncbi:SSU ribosomal protein S6P modification protein [Psychromonas ingrahamii 37]|uniref:SSU ribosomal protein S6P modification protein n=1 Tax=Psychromonas ingrahamii (strain DSM 17664 / CCUG 51855 / 37) TaxID=357804 RepID=A1SX48_PSYIN|nr:GAK system ATP-grasp enzyme [Psychromonas ingrahamii]ABM04063.1 SSU ribosomal protein S6P modification protein [Psychromonas ingrahamii 37]